MLMQPEPCSLWLYIHKLQGLPTIEHHLCASLPDGAQLQLEHSFNLVPRSTSFKWYPILST